jgi:hypothetical protein
VSLSATTSEWRPEASPTSWRCGGSCWPPCTGWSGGCSCAVGSSTWTARWGATTRQRIARGGGRVRYGGGGGDHRSGRVRPRRRGIGAGRWRCPCGTHAPARGGRDPGGRHAES